MSIWRGRLIWTALRTRRPRWTKRCRPFWPRYFPDAKKILSDHRNLLDEVALYLLAKETITGDELMRYVNAEQTALPASVTEEGAPEHPEEADGEA